MTDQAQPHVPETRLVSLSRLTRAPYNPRTITRAARDALTASLDEFGLVQPLVWNERTGNIVGGHQRFDILIARGVTETLAVVVDWDLETEKRANLALNNPHAGGEWDLEALLPMLDDVGADSSLALDALLAEYVDDALSDVQRVDASENPRLDQVSLHKCPECGNEFR